MKTQRKQVERRKSKRPELLASSKRSDSSPSSWSSSKKTSEQQRVWIGSVGMGRGRAFYNILWQAYGA
jgi:hypothetical protein